MIGLVKPAILLPASLLTQLTTDELAAILRHELAHIRRFDLPVQLIQKMIESLFFFHPTAWWLSRQIDDERENCCDDLAAAAGCSQVGYASALLRIAEVCLAKPKSQSNAQTIALSAGGSGAHQITRRIERQLMKDNRFVSPAGRSPVATIAIALGLSLIHI